jgi:hypothetical protein
MIHHLPSNNSGHFFVAILYKSVGADVKIAVADSLYKHDKIKTNPVVISLMKRFRSASIRSCKVTPRLTLLMVGSRTER